MLTLTLTLALVCGGPQVHAWDLRTLTLTLTLALVHGGPQVRAWDLRTARPRLLLTSHFGGVAALGLDPSADGGHGAYLSGGRDGTVQVP